MKSLFCCLGYSNLTIPFAYRIKNFKFKKIMNLLSTPIGTLKKKIRILIPFFLQKKNKIFGQNWISSENKKERKQFVSILCVKEILTSFCAMRRLPFFQWVEMPSTMKLCHLKNNQEAIQWRGIVKDRFLAAFQSCSFQNLALWILQKSWGGSLFLCPTEISSLNSSKNGFWYDSAFQLRQHFL